MKDRFDTFTNGYTIKIPVIREEEEMVYLDPETFERLEHESIDEIVDLLESSL